MPGKKTISLKKFLIDFRSGASELELMTKHDLDRRGLQKMMRVLEQRQLLTRTDLTQRDNASSDRHQAKSPFPEPGTQREPEERTTDAETVENVHSQCPQCGARVTDKMLTCPECGHVLPGEQRWSRVQSEKSPRVRVPPWLLGCIIACPIALGLYVVFKHMLIPMSAASIHKRTHAVAKPHQPLQGHVTASTDTKPALPSIHEHVRRLIEQGFLLSVTEDYSAFTVSDRWYDLSREDKIALLNQLGAALLAAGRPSSFVVKDDAGIPGARVGPQWVELLDKYGFGETIQRTDSGETAEAPADHTAAPSGSQ